MTTLIAGSTALASGLEVALAHGDPDGYVRLYERATHLLLDGVATDPTPDGLGAALREHSVRVVIDANDPFADGVSPALEVASIELGIPHLRVAPASFEDLPDARRWHWVNTLEEAAQAAWHGDSAPVVAVNPIELCNRLRPNDGRAAVAYRERAVGDVRFPPWLREPSRPVRVTSEAIALIESEAATVLIANDSGDPRVRLFLDASALTGVGVVMLRRPPRWQGLGGARTAGHEVVRALSWRSTVL